MRIVPASACMTLVIISTPLAAMELPQRPCATYAAVAEHQAPALREAAKEAELLAQAPIRVDEREVQPAFDKLHARAKAVADALDDLASAWEDVQVETLRCKLKAGRG